MGIRVATALAVLLALATSLAAAESPFAGTWKFDPAKSKLTGDTMKFEKTPEGEIRWSGSGLTYTFKVDGKVYKGPFDEAVVWKQINDTTWQTTNTEKGVLLSTNTLKLSPDSSTLTVVSKGTKPSGEAFEDTTVYQRTDGDKGLMGGWRDKQAKFSSPETVVLAPSGKDGLLFKTTGYQQTCDAQFGGKDYAVTGPTTPDGITMALTHAGPRSFRVVFKKDGKPLFRETYTVSQDGRTLTVTGSAIAVNEPYTEVFEKQ